MLYVTLAQLLVIGGLVYALVRERDKAAALLAEWARESAEERKALVAQVQRPGFFPPPRAVPEPEREIDPPDELAAVGRVIPRSDERLNDD